MDSRSTTVLTNLQRGNIEAKISTSISLSFYEKCGQGELFAKKTTLVNKIKKKFLQGRLRMRT